MPSFYCPHCKKKLPPNDASLKKQRIPSKFCTWCKQHIPARQSRKSHREKRK